jgi:hypothetical protein
MQIGGAAMPFETRIIEEDKFVLSRFDGLLTLDELETGRRQIKEVLKQCRWRKVLVDLRGVQPVVSTLELLEFNKAHATELPYTQIAVLIDRKLGDDGRFSENVAVNRGVNYRIFFDEESAKKWLTQK